LFIFDDAVPPTIGMAGPAPTQEWWVGEVWMLRHLLKPAGASFFAETCEAGPTGLLVAASFGKLDLAVSAGPYQGLAQIETDADLIAISKHVSKEEVIRLCDNIFRNSAKAGLVSLNAEIYGDTSGFERESGEGPTKWQKPKPDICLDLSGRGQEIAFLQRFDREIVPKFIDRFVSCHLVGVNAIIKDDVYYSRYANGARERMFTIARDLGSYGNFETGFEVKDGEVVIARSRFDAAIELKGPVFLGTPEEPDNWGMWLLIALPSLFKFQRNRNRYRTFLCDASNTWKSSLLREFGLKDDELTHHDRTSVYRCEDISLIRRSNRDLVVTYEERRDFLQVASNYGPTGVSKYGRRIYISRITRTRQLGAYRGLMNEEELIGELEKIGFQTVEPEFLSFADQVRAFKDAEVVVGLGGAAMFNVVFCQPGTKVVTIESTTEFLEAHTNMFASLGHRYSVIIGQEDLSDTRTVHRRWTVEVPRVVRTIRDLTS
jgi:hypothetical protein